jgi:hypothetical protein
MNRDQKIKQHVEETLHVLDQAERAHTDDYFFDRLDRRMNEKNQQAEMKPHRLIWSIAAAIILILANVFTMIHYNHAAKTRQNYEQVQEQSTNMIVEKAFFPKPIIYRQNRNQQ